MYNISLLNGHICVCLQNKKKNKFSRENFVEWILLQKECLRILSLIYIHIYYMSWNIFVKPKATVYYCCKLIYNHRISCKQITHAKIEVTIESFSWATITSLQQAGRGLPIS